MVGEKGKEITVSQQPIKIKMYDCSTVTERHQPSIAIAYHHRARLRTTCLWDLSSNGGSEGHVKWNGQQCCGRGPSISLKHETIAFLSNVSSCMLRCVRASLCWPPVSSGSGATASEGGQGLLRVCALNLSWSCQIYMHFHHRPHIVEV